MLNKDDIDDHFPIRKDGQPSYREGQKEACEFIVDSFNSGKKYVFLEGPTGSGKSAIGMTIASMVKSTYYLTATKILQDQLVNSFGDDVVELKGRNAYPCTFYDRYGSQMVRKGIWTQLTLDKLKSKNADCASGFCRAKSADIAAGESAIPKKCTKCFLVQPTIGPMYTGKVPVGDLAVLPQDMVYSACPYYEQVFTALNSKTVAMNFSSFLFQTQMTRRFKEPRNLLIIDECHHTEPQLLDFVSLTLSDAELGKYGIIIPELESAIDYAVFWRDAKVKETITRAIFEASQEDQSWVVDNLTRIVKKYERFEANIFGEDAAEWIHTYEELKNGSRRVTMKPIYVKQMAEQLLFRHADMTLMMSATILDVDVMCKSLGISRDDVGSRRLVNRFPVKNRPIYLSTVGKLTGGAAGMISWGDDLVKGVEDKVRKFAGKRGIIHTHNFQIMLLLKDRCSPDVSSRFLTQDAFNNDKNAMLTAHSKRKDSILVAPAMHEGIDLCDDLSRFQIVCKVPYPNLHDNEQLDRRTKLDRNYYIWLTAVKLVQSVGRSIRSDEDYADTYILDESIYRFMDDAKKMLPSWFKEAVKEELP